MTRIWIYRAVVLILILCLGGYWGWAMRGERVVQLPPLPPETVRVEVVKEIPVEVPGPERVVERVKWRTREVEVPVETVREVVRVVERAAEIGALQAQVDARGDRYEGLDPDGDYRAGWKGSLSCAIRAEAAAPWTVVAEEPFSLELSRAITTQPVKPPGRPGGLEIRLGVGTAPSVDFGASWYRRGRSWGLWAQGTYRLDPFDAYVGDNRYFSEGTWEVAGGVVRRW